METTIWHNPECGTSRNTLALLRATGAPVNVVEYLKTPPEADTLRRLWRDAGLSPRDGLRRKGTPFDALGLGDPTLPEERIFAAVADHPILINRPLVETPLGVRLCRPSDLVLDIIGKTPMQALRKEEDVPFLRDTRIDGDAPSLAAALDVAELPTDDLNLPGRIFWQYDDLAGDSIGVGGIEPLGIDVLVRSLVVTPAARGIGIGHNMLAVLLRRAYDLGCRKAWLLTTTAGPFFAGCGFTPVDRKAAPPSVLATRQAATLCPASATLMTREISP